ncbi:MAG: (deoxy)nucleoside triphosphate pyrophosphohydrolase [Bacteroidetes bacterium]|nr:MAG: (deoxy)nucleoside triphosphate pyrophosphohydrolase [Bacteroidota bacterium]
MNNPSPIHVSCAIIECNGQVLAAQRGQHTSNAGKWEFPGGKIEKGETSETCLRREILEELAIGITITASLPAFTHHYPDRTICLHPFVCSYNGAPVIAGEHQKIVWLAPEEIPKLNWSEADIKVWEYYLQEYL